MTEGNNVLWEMWSNSKNHRNVSVSPFKGLRNKAIFFFIIYWLVTLTSAFCNGYSILPTVWNLRVLTATFHSNNKGMGIIASKIFKMDLKSKAEEDMKGGAIKETAIPDVRSTTSLMKTPVVEEKFSYKKDFNSEDELVPCNNKVLKNLKFDPRSPTVGIYRTPIMVEDTDSNKKRSHSFNSPVSIYSCNLNNSILQDVVTPSEPSVNVSGFEETKHCESEFEMTVEVEATIETAKNAKLLKIIDRPNTYEARKLLDEITLSDEENFLKKIKMSSNKGKKSSLKTPGKKIIFDSKGNQLKNRPPLSNITSSTNSPNQINTSVKSFSRNKVLPEYGAENNVSPKIQCMMQWDKNTTVII